METANDTLARALLSAQRDMPAVEKNATNPHFRSKYTTIDHLLAKTLPVLRKHGLLVTQWPTTVDGREGLRTRVDHVDSGEWMEDVMVLAMAKAGPQEQGSCLTYAKRYALGALLCISTEDDDDANAASVKDAPAAGVQASAPSVADGPDRETAAGAAQLATEPQRKLIRTLDDELEAKGVLDEEKVNAARSMAADESLPRASARKALDRLTALAKGES